MSISSDQLNKYKDRFVTAAGDIRQRSIEVKNKVENEMMIIYENVKQMIDVMSALTDFTPITNGPTSCQKIMETQLWTAVCLVSLSLGRVLGNQLYGFGIGLLVTRWTTVPWCNLVIPLFGYIFLVHKSHHLDVDLRRSLLLSLALILGTLEGHNFAQQDLHALAPPTFLMPMVIGLCAELCGLFLLTERLLFLTATVGMGMLSQVVIGMLFNQLGACYMMFVLLGSVGSITSMQLLINQIHKGTSDDITSQLIDLYFNLTLHTLLVFMFAPYKN